MISHHDNTKARGTTGRGFSLIELMIAIVILGLGMVMVSTMFPVAMDRARKLTDATKSSSVIDAAQSHVLLTTRVNGVRGTSFVGDMIIATDSGGSPRLISLSDTRVHLLHMENLLVGDAASNAPRGFTPTRLRPWQDELLPWHIDPPDFVPGVVAAYPMNLSAQGDNFCSDFPDHFCLGSIQDAQTRFEDRVYPPLRPRTGLNPDLSGTFGGSGSTDDTEWDEQFNTRKYAWAVLHRLTQPIGPMRTDDSVNLDVLTQNAIEASNSVRTMDMFYVVLRRPNPVFRFARQDPATAPNIFPASHADSNGDTYNYELTSTPDRLPVALPPENDVLLPEPWRVQIQIPDSIVSQINSTGIPTEIEVPPRSVVSGSVSATAEQVTMLGEMFRKGTRFIDEVNGQVYRVVKRRLSDFGQGSGDIFGYILTLDREITVEDVEDQIPQARFEPPCIDCVAGVADPQERLRTVWVFPPPVLAERADDGVVIYDGPQTVVDIQVRPTAFSPVQ
ncbi:MAG: type II secretion system protein [Planctomycetota bacterium]|jgi:prepilin-type N-terminal cleavage/methylation domain-containing protein